MNEPDPHVPHSPSEQRRPVLPPPPQPRSSDNLNNNNGGGGGGGGGTPRQHNGTPQSPRQPTSPQPMLVTPPSPQPQQGHDRSHHGEHAASPQQQLQGNSGQQQQQPPPQQSSSSRRGNLQFGSGRFVLKARLGSGSFGDIFRGFDTFNNRDVAIKLEQTRTRHPQLAYESKVYRLLHADQDVVGIPQLYWFGVEAEYNAMAIELCGPCLEDLFNFCLRKFSLKTVLMIGEQMLHRIEYLHTRGLIHRDIKPENFVFGLAEKGHHLMLIDFGLSKKYWDHRTRSHIPFRDGKPLTGTARYCSTNTHRGYEQSRRDDLESIGFLLIYFMVGQLPWQGIAAPDAQSKTVRIGEKKIATPLEELCRECPTEFLQYMRYCRNLRFVDTPDYSHLRGLFRAVAERQGITYDWCFDWITKREEERREAKADGDGAGPLPSEVRVTGASQLTVERTVTSR